MDLTDLNNASSVVNLGDVRGARNFTPPLIYTHPVSSVFYIGYVSLVVLVGVVSNSVIIAVLGHDISKKCNKIGSEFLMNLAISDLGVSGLMNPFMIVAAVHGEEFFTIHSWLCTTVASLCLALCFVSFFSITCLAINRYIYTCRNDFYRSVYTSRTTKVLISGIWIMACVCEIPNFFGWGGHSFDKKKIVCTWDRTANLSYTLFVTIVLIGGSLIVTAVCYYKIFAKIRKTKRNVAEYCTKDASAPGTGTHQVGTNFLKSIKLVKSLIIVYLVFAVCWIPFAIIVSADFQDRLPYHVHLAANLLAHTHAGVNCAIFFITNRAFRTRCQVLFQKMLIRIQKLDEEDQRQQTLQMESLFHS